MWDVVLSKFFRTIKRKLLPLRCLKLKYLFFIYIKCWVWTAKFIGCTRKVMFHPSMGDWTPLDESVVAYPSGTNGGYWSLLHPLLHNNLCSCRGLNNSRPAHPWMVVPCGVHPPIHQCPAGTRTRPDTRYFIWYPTRPDSFLKIIG